MKKNYAMYFTLISITNISTHYISIHQASNMSCEDILICEKDIKVMTLEKKVKELEKNIRHMKEASTSYHHNYEYL